MVHKQLTLALLALAAVAGCGGSEEGADDSATVSVAAIRDSIQKARDTAKVEAFDDVRREPHVLGDGCGELRDPRGTAAMKHVAGLHRGHECLDDGHRQIAKVRLLLLQLPRAIGDFVAPEDRIAVFEGREQTFGTQFDWDADGLLSPAPIRDRAGVDERRASVGLPSMAETIAQIRAGAAAERETAPADLQQRRADFEAWARRVGWRA